ncbi:myelin-oligodendrocyte glycoprotein-like isoform X5 [Sebastes fasciatus]|uniref:myelin-oligodendrocyte glycoprotein-like isoform X5 n=1 Tax=Sebastes fasciatus TaxID=394691 RepID=UPI003D9F92F3
MSLFFYPVFSCLTGTWWLVPLLLFGLLLYSCMVVCTEVEGRSRMIGSSQRIVSVLGDDVILPCHLEPQLNVENLTVQWWKPDIPLDPEDPQSNYRYVHSYHENHDEEDMKMSLYKGRTALNKDGLKHGNISLKIMNVRLSDQGRYRCEIPQLACASLIMLVIGGRHHLIVLVPVLVLILILGGGVAGYLLRHKCQKQNCTKYDVQSQVDKLDQQHNGYR